MYQANLTSSIIIILSIYAIIVLWIKFSHWIDPSPNYVNYPNVPFTHDFSNKEYTYSEIEPNIHGGLLLIQSVKKLQPRDFIILDNERSTTRYTVVAQSTSGLPTDLLQIKIKFAPRFLNNDKPIKS